MVSICAVRTFVILLLIMSIIFLFDKFQFDFRTFPDNKR